MIFILHKYRGGETQYPNLKSINQHQSRHYYFYNYKIMFFEKHAVIEKFLVKVFFFRQKLS